MELRIKTLNRVLQRVQFVVVMVLGALALNSTAQAQTVSPVINELGNPAKGHVEYRNDSLTPLNVVLEMRSFTVSDTGELSFRPLDSNIHVKLSQTSFRIQPQQTYHVFYEATSKQAPAWFVIYANFTGFPFRTAQGMNVRLQLPHTVYLLPKQSAQKDEIQVNRAELNVVDNKVTIEVENTGDNFGRVLATELLYSKKKQDAPGFPVFPHRKRILEIPLDTKAEGENVPVEVSLGFQNFKIEQKLQRAAAVASVTEKPQTAEQAEEHKGNP
ncbi:MAG TPA: hypothetical protein VFA90_13500 [Terriglobales bacterium]|nr:hypothetical protein [Terriglobales bacterium]